MPAGPAGPAGPGGTRRRGHGNPGDDGVVVGGRQRKLGFALGAAVGAGITAAIAGPDWNRGGISRDQFAGLVATNALIGGWVGFAFGPREWTELPLQR